MNRRKFFLLWSGLAVWRPAVKLAAPLLPQAPRPFVYALDEQLNYSLLARRMDSSISTKVARIPLVIYPGRPHD